MPTCGSFFARAALARASAGLRPSVCGRAASATVQPSWPAGQSAPPRAPWDESPVVVSGAVANPPVAVTILSLPPPPASVAAMAAAAPASATTAATDARRAQREPRIDPVPARAAVADSRAALEAVLLAGGERLLAARAEHHSPGASAVSGRGSTAPPS